MNIDLFEMLHILYLELDQYGCSELNENECRLIYNKIKDILNLLDCRMYGKNKQKS